MLQEILFRQLDLAEEADFRKYVQENDSPEIAKWWIYHPVSRPGRPARKRGARIETPAE